MTAVPEIIMYMILFIVLYFQVFLLLTFIEDKTEKSRNKLSLKPVESKSLPSVTIVVPCFNEGKTVSGTIDSLLALQYPKDKIKIVAVNDGSTDNTLSILREYETKHGIAVFDKENGGKYTALNLAIDKSESDIIGCLDADSFVIPESLKEIVKKFENPEVMAVTPAIVVSKPKNILELVQKAEYNTGLFIRNMLCRFNALHVTPGPFSFFRKEVFQKIGKYKHGHNTEDMELAMRMQSHHMKIDNAPKAYVYTVIPKNYRSLFKQRVRWVYGFLKNALDYRKMFFDKKYGNFGMFYLPISFFSVFASLYLFFFLVYRIFLEIYNKILEIFTVGFDFGFNFDWFFLDTRSLSFISLIFLVTTVFILIVGKKMSEDKGFISKDIIYFLLFYAFISPFWFAKAVYNTAVSKEARWR